MASVTVPNYGFLNGLAEGANSFLNAYQTTKNIKHQQKMQELLSGVTQDANGNLVLTPEKQQMMQAQAAQAQGLIRANTPEGYKESAIMKVGPQGLIPQFDEDSRVKGFDVNEKLFKAKAEANPLAGVKLAQLEETKNQNSTKVGQEYEHDPIIRLSKTNLNSLKRAHTGLSDPSAPVTTKDLNLYYNDYMNAVAAGGQATEGKIHRELPSNFETMLNEMRQKGGDNADLRKTSDGKALVDLLSHHIDTVSGDISNAVAEQANNIHDNYLQSTNPKVIEANKIKLRAYAPDAYAKRYGGDTKGLVGNSAKYASEHPEDLNQAPVATPKEGDTKEWKGKTYKVVGGHWVAQ